MKKYRDTELLTLEDGDIRLPDRSCVTNKGDCGRLLIVGGDRGMAGAPSFAAEAAYRSGTGLVEILTHPDNRIPVQILIPEAVSSFWGEWDPKRLSSYSAVTIGVGLGRSEDARKLLYQVLSRVAVPTVIDADGLNVISDTPELCDLLGNHTVLTPHIMEFSRLTGKSVDEIKAAPLDLAKAFCQKYNTNMILKDSVSLVVLASGKTFANTTGDSTLSKGGSGDILAGLTGSLLAQGMSLEEALPLAPYLFGKAGERAGCTWGQRGALARDVIKELALTIEEYQKKVIIR